CAQPTSALPQKRTLLNATRMSALCQTRTYAVQQFSSLSDHRVGPWRAAAAMHLPSVAHDETAVDVNGLARHVIGVTAGEKAHDASHVFRSFGSAEGDQRGSRLPGFTDFPALYFGPLGVVGRQHLRRSARDADNAGFT